MSTKKKIGILGASGYTGAELLRFLIRHPGVEIELLTADRRAGHAMSDVFPQFAPYKLPALVSIEEIDWAKAGLDLIFCALPHATTQKVLKEVLAKAPSTKIVDLSADFRLSDPKAYAKWYGHEHHALELQKEAIYGVVEIYREDIKKARLVANPGCYTTTAILPVVPLLRAGAIEPDEIIVDAKSGMTGAGRGLKEEMIFAEVAEGVHAYGVGGHRHVAELDQEFSKASGKNVVVTFTPHLMPMNRGIYATIYVKGRSGKTAQDIHAVLAAHYAKEEFIHILPFGKVPQSRHVRGSNMTFIGVVADRQPGRAIICSTLDNLAKGASGQAVQNANLLLGFAESTGIDQVPMFP